VFNKFIYYFYFLIQYHFVFLSPVSDCIKNFFFKLDLNKRMYAQSIISLSRPWLVSASRREIFYIACTSQRSPTIKMLFLFCFFFFFFWGIAENILLQKQQLRRADSGLHEYAQLKIKMQRVSRTMKIQQGVFVLQFLRRFLLASATIHWPRQWKCESLEKNKINFNNGKDSDKVYPQRDLENQFSVEFLHGTDN
jgi:hypothetical protein